MALEASHIRFALDLSEELRVENHKEYIAGSIYPDSRYITGMRRGLTHVPNYGYDDFFMSSDFHKGWYTHLLLDELQYEAMKEIFPELIISKINGFDEAWIKVTALKILQDQLDLTMLNKNIFKNFIIYKNTPNGENEDDIKKYYEYVLDMYTVNLSKEDMYKKFWKGTKLPNDIYEKLFITVDEFRKNEELLKRAGMIYETTLGLYKEVILNKS